MEYIDHVQPSGKRIGAVNATRREKDGTWSGDMFDGQGMVRALKNNGFDVKGKRVMMAGAGGVGSAIADSLGVSGVKTLLIYDIDEAKANELAANVAKNHGVDARFSKPTLDGIDLFANATAVGMDGNGMSIKVDKFDPSLFVFDVITHDTPLLAFARQCGCRSLGGLPMTQAQADLLVDFILGAR
jgi:shikimate dehydrogenase